jgi:hypothetical protein
MVIDDLDVLGPRIGPAKADPELVVDPESVLSCPVALEGFQMISGRNAQVLQPSGDFQLPKFPASHSGEIGEPFDWIAFRQGFRLRAQERFDHGKMVTLCVTTAKGANNANGFHEGNSQNAGEGNP